MRALPGVVAVLTAADIPGANDCGPIVHDDPILADGEVRYLGQPVFAVIATTRDAARRAAARAKEVLDIEPLPPVLTPREAHAQAAVRAAADAPGARRRAAPAIAAAPHRLHGTLEVGGQEQFYLEGQISYAIPREDDGMLVHCSTQHPSEMQHLVAHALEPARRTRCRSNAGAWAAASAARSRSRRCSPASPRWPRASSSRPVKLRLDRDDDFLDHRPAPLLPATTTRSATTTTAACSAPR